MREETSKALSSFQSTPSKGAADVLSAIESRLDRRSFRMHHWEGTFFEYLDIVMERPGAVRNAAGATDTDNNLSDFAIVNAPVPRNRAWFNTACLVTPTRSSTWGQVKSIYR